MSEIFDMCTEIKTHKLTFVLNPNRVWDTFNKEFVGIVNKKWNEIKFLNTSGAEINPQLNSLVPNDCGGIYIFTLRTDIIPEIHRYILYVGRVKKTDNQNLRKRINEYYKDNRPKITLMREIWGKDLYVRFLPLNDNDVIERLEEELIRIIVPPCNDRYPGVINSAIKIAFM